MVVQRSVWRAPHWSADARAAADRRRGLRTCRARRAGRAFELGGRSHRWRPIVDGGLDAREASEVPLVLALQRAALHYAAAEVRVVLSAADGWQAEWEFIHGCWRRNGGA